MNPMTPLVPIDHRDIELGVSTLKSRDLVEQVRVIVEDLTDLRPSRMRSV